MNNIQKELRLLKLEQSMRDAAICISNYSLKMEEITPLAASNALKGIIEYLQEQLADIKIPQA